MPLTAYGSLRADRPLNTSWSRGAGLRVHAFGSVNVSVHIEVSEDSSVVATRGLGSRVGGGVKAWPLGACHEQTSGRTGASANDDLPGLQSAEHPSRWPRPGRITGRIEDGVRVGVCDEDGLSLG